jgi:hypothetical protein
VSLKINSDNGCNQKSFRWIWTYKHSTWANLLLPVVYLPSHLFLAQLYILTSGNFISAHTVLLRHSWKGLFCFWRKYMISHFFLYTLYFFVFITKEIDGFPTFSTCLQEPQILFFTLPPSIWTIFCFLHYAVFL